jgi:hypothetical protein
VTPALAWTLKGHPGIPSEARDYFETILTLNGGRNEALLNGLKRILAALNAVGIEPVLLKGAARLAEGTYPEPNVRFLGDLDVLIPAAGVADAVAALQAIGFCTNATDPPLPPGHHHLPVLHGGEAVGVELHTDVLRRASAKVIPTDWFRAGTRPSSFRSQRIRLAQPTRSVGHLVVHDQPFHDGYQLRRVQLRHVLDVCMIRAAHESAIDWVEIDQRFCRCGIGDVLATYFAIAESLFGQPAPHLCHAPSSSAIDALRRLVEHGEPRRWGVSPGC